MTRPVIIGGSDAGISDALRAREICLSVEPTFVVADRYPNYQQMLFPSEVIVAHKPV